MDLSTKVLGASVVTYLRDRQSAPVLRIGTDTFDRAQLSRRGCFNFTAAANLSAILNRELAVANTKDVYERISPAALALPRLGAVSLAVLGAAFEAKGLGGSTPLENWLRKHRPDAALVTFASLKHREEQERAREAKATRARKATRRDKAHRIRVDRFTTRAEGSVAP